MNLLADAIDLPPFRCEFCGHACETRLQDDSDGEGMHMRRWTNVVSDCHGEPVLKPDGAYADLSDVAGREDYDE